MNRFSYVEAVPEGVDLGDHPFPLEKYALVGRMLREELLVPEERFLGPGSILDEDLARVHTPRYLKDLAAARRSRATERSELPVTEEIIAGFREMVGASIVTVQRAVADGLGFCIGGGFHHAYPDHAEGFCYFHDMAIAVERVRAEVGLERVLFVDVDVHQGNGTAVIYSLDPDTFTYSIHQERNYPVKERSDLDRGLADETGDDEYLARLAEDLEAVDARFGDPDLICYVAGVDPAAGDLLGGLALSAEGLRRRDDLVVSRYRGRGIPMAVFLAGGYAPSATRTARLHLGTAWACEERG